MSANIRIHLEKSWRVHHFEAGHIRLELVWHRHKSIDHRKDLLFKFLDLSERFMAGPGVIIIKGVRWGSTALPTRSTRGEISSVQMPNANVICSWGLIVEMPLRDEIVGTEEA